MNHFSQKILKHLLLLVVFFTGFNQVNAANISINDNEVKSTSADLIDNDSIDFIGTSGAVTQGELQVDSDRTLANISAANSGGVGNINFITAKLHLQLMVI